jgi:hypothetical protein
VISALIALTFLCALNLQTQSAIAYADLIDFETGFHDGEAVTTVVTATNEVSFWIEGGRTAYIAQVGYPITAFLPNDEAVGSNHGDYCLTDQPPPEDQHGAWDYYMSFALPVTSLSLDLYDFREWGAGNYATLMVFSDLDMTLPIGTAVFTIPDQIPEDGNVVRLSIDNPAGLILSASLFFTTLPGGTDDGGTAIDNIEFTTYSITPTEPLVINAVAIAKDKIALSWTTPGDEKAVAGYNIYRSGNYLKSVPGNSTVDAGLFPSIRYCYEVTAYDGEGNEWERSAVSCAITFPPPSVDIVLPDTGQTKCYNNSTEIPCPRLGEPFHGQDGKYLINPPSYTKLDENSEALPDDAASWAMVRDNNTGLIWEAKTDDGGLHDKDHRYTFDQALQWVASLNTSKYLGYEDWRLPSISELQGIVDYGKRFPAVKAQFFPDTPYEYPQIHWSVTESVEAARAWGLWGDGQTHSEIKSRGLYVRAVRGMPAPSVFVNNTDGTVSDLTTGLMWEQKTDDGGLGDKDNMYTWQEALEWITELNAANYLGYHDWRLPSVKELQTIIDYSRSLPAVNPAYFPNTASSIYWTSTTVIDDKDYAWAIWFNYGYIDFNWQYFEGKTATASVRAVRGPKLLEIAPVVSKYYMDILDRIPDEGGQQFWSKEIDRITRLGIDIKEGFIALARYFFASEEYFLKNKTDEPFIHDLYQTFLNRPPDPGGLAFWLDYLSHGLTRPMLITQLGISEEFIAYMQTLLSHAPTRPENNLLNDLYRGFLNRFPDDAGFAYWLGRMRLAQCSGPFEIRALCREIALAFTQSAEYQSRARDNLQYVEDLYNAMLRRGADPEGFTFWIDHLDDGIYTREELIEFFVDSPEFQMRVDQVIAAGCIP